MQVKQSEICTNGSWRMRTGHVNGMRWILGRHAVAYVKAWKTRECKKAKCKICGNAKPTRYVSVWNTNCVGSQNARNMWDAWKCEESEMWNAWNMRDAWKCETHENAKTWKHARYASAQNANCGITKCTQYVRCTKTQGMRKHENIKIVKVAALQQVQYKVLQYGLYVPIETWVSTAMFLTSPGDLNSECPHSVPYSARVWT